MDPILYILIVVVACTMAGVFLLMRSVRMSTAHLCLKCGYNLHGLPAASRCPECGAVLDGTNTIVPGQWRTKSWPFAIGILLLAVAGIALLGIMWFLFLVLLG